MKKLILILTSAIALIAASSASAALTPGVYDPANTGCPTATYSGGVLHLAKNCATTTNAAAYGSITGLTGQAFTSGSFTLANVTQCQGGSPRFNVVTTAGTFFLGCNNVTPTTNSDGTLTYTFDAASIAASGLPVPTGTITSASVLVDVQGTADVSKITVNGTSEVPEATTSGTPTSKSDCKNDGWKTFTNPTFKNQGECVSFVNHLNHKRHHGEHGKHHRHHGEHAKSGDAKHSDFAKHPEHAKCDSAKPAASK